MKASRILVYLNRPKMAASFNLEVVMLSASVGVLKGKHLEQVTAFLTLIPSIVSRFELEVGRRLYKDCWVMMIAPTHVVFAHGTSLCVGDKSPSSLN